MTFSRLTGVQLYGHSNIIIFLGNFTSNVENNTKCTQKEK